MIQSLITFLQVTMLVLGELMVVAVMLLTLWTVYLNMAKEAQEFAAYKSIKDMLKNRTAEDILKEIQWKLNAEKVKGFNKVGPTG